MSEPISALNGAVFDGIARIEDCGLQGMITLRGDLADRKLAAAVKKACGQKMPGIREALVEDGQGLFWMSPDELLLLVPQAEAGATVAELSAALSGMHALAVDMSDARSMFRVSGPAAREVMAKLAPVDMSREAFRPGQIRRTRLAQVPAAFWMDDEESFRVVCFRSVARYVFDLLSTAAQEGSEVGVL